MHKKNSLVARPGSSRIRPEQVAEFSNMRITGSPEKIVGSDFIIDVTRVTRERGRTTVFGWFTDNAL